MEADKAQEVTLGMVKRASENSNAGESSMTTTPNSTKICLKETSQTGSTSLSLRHGRKTEELVETLYQYKEVKTMEQATAYNANHGLKPISRCDNEMIERINANIVKSKARAYSLAIGVSKPWEEAQLNAIANVITDGHYRTITAVDVELVFREALHGYDDGKVSLYNVSTPAIARLFENYEESRLRYNAGRSEAVKLSKEEENRQNAAIMEKYKSMMQAARPNDFDKNGNDIRQQRIDEKLRKENPECYDTQGNYNGKPYKDDAYQKLSSGASLRERLRSRSVEDVDYENQIKKNGYKPL